MTHLSATETQAPQHDAKTRPFRFLGWLALPHVAILIGASLSLVAWLLPTFGGAGKGFVASQSEFHEVIWAIVAYLGIATAAAAGYYIGIPMGRRLPTGSAERSTNLASTSIWTVFILLGAIGVAFATLKVIDGIGFWGCITAIASFRANAMKAVLYSDYSFGMLSLRYIAILAGGIAIYRYLAYREVSAKTLASFALLMVVAVMSSRLSIIWALVIGGTTYVVAPIEQGKRHIKFVEVLSWSVVFLVLVGALTISRTFGFYQKRGAETFVAAVGTEFQRYLAAPFQGSIEAVNYADRRSRLTRAAGIDVELTTNSAFLDLAASVGSWNVAALAAILFSSGLACGILMQFRSTYFIVLLGVLQSCHLEIWRIMMFPKGITITLVLAALLFPLVLSFVSFPAIRLPVIRIRAT